MSQVGGNGVLPLWDPITAAHGLYTAADLREHAQLQTQDTAMEERSPQEQPASVSRSQAQE